MLKWLHTKICFLKVRIDSKMYWIVMFTLLVINSVFKSQLPWILLFAQGDCLLHLCVDWHSYISYLNCYIEK